jgi:hypothetical protein
MDSLKKDTPHPQITLKSYSIVDIINSNGALRSALEFPQVVVVFHEARSSQLPNNIKEWQY